MRIGLRTKLESVVQFWQDCLKKYPVMSRMYTIFSWISLLALVLSLIFMEDSRKMFVQFLWSFYLMLQFWFLCRSKTLNWRKYTHFFLAGAWLIAPLNVMIIGAITALFGGAPDDLWSNAVLSPVAEEALKLLPLGVCMFLSRKASSLSLCDFALIGAASGAGVQFVEEIMRRFASSHYGFSLFNGFVLNWDVFTLFPGYFESNLFPGTMTAGHPLLAASVALGIGFAYRFKTKYKGYGFIFPLILIIWAMLDHGIWNAGSHVPDWLDSFHGMIGGGYVSRPLFLIMLVIALFIDYWDLNRVREGLPVLNGEKVINPFSELWQEITSLFKNRRRFGYLLLFYRERRELGFTRLHGQTETKAFLPQLQYNVHHFYKALVVLIICLCAAYLFTDWVNTNHGADACLACLFDRLQNWWDGLSGWERGSLVLGAFAVTFPLLGFWSSVGLISIGTGIAASGHQTADIIRHPKKLLTPETAIAIGIGALMSRIPFGRAIERLGGRLKNKPFAKKVSDFFTGGRGSGKPPRNKDEDPFQRNHAHTTKPDDFTDIRDLDDFRSRIPEDAVELPWNEVPGGATEGVKYRWTDENRNVWNVRAHSPDPSAPPGSNAHEGWIYRAEVKTDSGRWTMDSQGNFHKKNVFNPNSPYYNEKIANDSHIPFTK